MNKNNLDSLNFFTSSDRVLNLERYSQDSRLSKMLQIATKNSRILIQAKEKRRYYWDERRFRLCSSQTFNALTNEVKEKILEHLSNHSLRSSYYIEKSAVTYCSKMALMAESFDEKMLYIQIGSEEVTHFLEFEAFLSANEIPVEKASPFTSYINDLIQGSGREISFLIAQVFLEGMGIHHYTQLLESCIDEDMKTLIEQVLHDEARHHGSGLVLLDNATLTDELIEDMVKVTKILIPILKRQALMLADIFHMSSVTLQQSEKIMLEINIDDQMKERVDVIRNGLKKLKNSNLKKALTEAIEG